MIRPAQYKGGNKMYKISLPIYYTQKFKNKKDKNILVGMNWYRNSNFFINNKVKKHYKDLIEDKLFYFIDDQIEGKYKVKYKLYYKNPRSDMMNIVSVIDKFLNDALQDYGLVKEDNVKFYTRCVVEVAEQDKENPRIEIEIEEMV